MSPEPVVQVRFGAVAATLTLAVIAVAAFVPDPFPSQKVYATSVDNVDSVAPGLPVYFAGGQASAPGEVRQAATLFWEEPPSAMVEHALLRGLGARLGAPVLPTAVAAGEAQVLRVSLERFEEHDGSDQVAESWPEPPRTFTIDQQPIFEVNATDEVVGNRAGSPWSVS